MGFGARRLGTKFWQLCLYMVVGVLVCYAFGTAWYMILSGNSLGVSLSYCVWPFLPGDAVKILLAAVLTLRLRRFTQPILPQKSH